MPNASNASKTGVILIIIVVIIIAGLIWSVSSTNKNMNTTLNNNPGGNTALGTRTGDQSIRNDLNDIDAGMTAIDQESRNMDAYNI